VDPTSAIFLSRAVRRVVFGPTDRSMLPRRTRRRSGGGSQDRLCRVKAAMGPCLESKGYTVK